MVRTRDFLLWLLAVAFLLIAIVVTSLWYSDSPLPSLSTWWEGAVSGESEYVGDVPVVPDERESRLEILRAKVAEKLARTASDEESGDSIPLTATSTDEDAVATASTTTTAVVKTCANYRSLQIPWIPQAVLQENREGVRVYFERGLPDPTSSTTPELIRTIIPLRSWPNQSSTCLPTDVIGIATDGSLIRNDELALYTVFGPDTIVGYSLDGFAIYGPSNQKTDICGGATVDGTYRYILDAKRPGLINCFAGSPVTVL